MAIVNVVPRHTKKCREKNQGNDGAQKRCKCPLQLRWGKKGRKSAKTRSWEIANKKARLLEQELNLKEMGIDPPKKAEAITIESGVDLYLKDMDQRGVQDVSKARRLLGRLREFANAKGVILLKDVTALLLTEWRNGWTFKQLGTIEARKRLAFWLLSDAR